MRYTVLFLSLLASCTIDVDHKLPDDPFSVGIDIGFEGECLACFPVCSATVAYCEDSTTRPCSGCQIACLGGREFICTPEGIPRCLNEGPDGTFAVPTICVARTGPFPTATNIGDGGTDTGD